MRSLVITAIITIGLLALTTPATLAQQRYYDESEGTNVSAGIKDLNTEIRSGDESVLDPEWEQEEPESPFDKPIETDRHDFTQSPKVVGCGVAQLEYGFFYSFKEEGTERERTFATPELLLRYGLSDRMEVRGRFNYAWKLSNEEDDLGGLEDVRLSLKYALTEQKCRRPESAVELRLSAPVGGDDMTTGRWEPGIDYIYGWEFGEYLSLTGSTGANANGLGDVAFVNSSSSPGDQFVAWSQSFALGAKMTRRITCYFEWYGIHTDGRQEELSTSFLNLGLDYLLSKNTVIDFRVGWGLTDDSDDLFAGIGGAFRF